MFSPCVLSFSWLYVSFSSHFHLPFSSLIFFGCFWLFSSILPTSYVFTLFVFVTIVQCTYFLLFCIIFLLLPLPICPLPLSLFFSFCLCTAPAWRPQKEKTKTWFCFYWQNRRGLSEFYTNDILRENIALCCRVQTKFGEIRFFEFSET